MDASQSYRCVECGKTAHETGKGESILSLCWRCWLIDDYASKVIAREMKIFDVPDEYATDVMAIILRYA